MMRTCQRCGEEFKPNCGRHFYCPSCKVIKKNEWRKHSGWKVVKCRKCGLEFEGWYRTMFCAECRPAEAYKLQVKGIDKWNQEKKNPPRIVPNECWAILALTMIEKCNGDKDCWTCTVNYFCENAILDLPVVAAML